MKKLFVVLMILSLITTSVFAQAAAEQAEEKVVTIIQDANLAEVEWYKQMNADFEAETGIKVDVQFAASTGNEFSQKMNIDLMAGTDVDIVPLATLRDYYAQLDAGFLAPLSSLIPNGDEIWGGNIIREADGDFYAVPLKQEIYIIFYNKDLFDAAGVPYPETPWTWDEMIATAEKLTDPDNGIYGLYVDRYGAPWGFLPARQDNVPLYKEDGTANFDDPRFIEVIDTILELDEKKIAMPYTEALAGGAKWNYYAIIGDRCAMYPSLNFMTRELNNIDAYGRTWRYGVAAMPTANEKNDLTNISYAAMNANAKHPESAATYLEWIGKNQWKYEKAGIPTLAKLTAEEQDLALSSIAEGSNGSLTVAELYKAYFDTENTKSVSAEFFGPAAEAYYQIITEEIRALHLGTTATTEECVAKVVSRANEAIANAQ